MSNIVFILLGLAIAVIIITIFIHTAIKNYEAKQRGGEVHPIFKAGYDADVWRDNPNNPME